MFNDIQVANLGRVGDTVDALVLFVEEKDMTLMLSPYDADLINHISEVMPALVNIVLKKRKKKNKLHATRYER